MKTIAALFVETNGVYFGLEGVEPWDAKRDARKYTGPYPVVAHPPCGRWCQLAFINEARYGHKVGDDLGCFASALGSVRKWGGVLEHPARSYAWKTFGLDNPGGGRGWLGTKCGGYVTQVAQRNYGHLATKGTWLYFSGPLSNLPVFDWTEPKAPEAQVSYLANHGNSPLPRLTKKQASRTPLPFRDLLISIARAA